MRWRVWPVGATTAPDDRTGPVLVLLRRAGVVVGVLFGLGLVALVAGVAAADERDGTPGNQVLGGLTQPLTDHVVTPVARAVTEPVAPVVRPLADTVAPVVAALEPVLDPVLASVAPVTEPLLAPVFAAVAPVVAPVAEATGLDRITDRVTDRSTGTAPGAVPRQDGVVPADRVPDAPVTAAVPGPVPDMPVTGAVVPVTATAPVGTGFRAGARAVPSSPVPAPGAPGGPVHHAVTGGGAAGGSGGGAHGADGLVSGPDGVLPDRRSAGRAPPGTVTGAARFSYDDRDHPS